ncbi:unnamed protein product [Prorocentrum cordatum]|uniref:Secreted protein n=1 Tax=Prorocentrum cordatum TaxID=2364126 RepID=A0ABN9X9S1_9DINO|nr:unnamed protein product [Polarella glacialis]
MLWMAIALIQVAAAMAVIEHMMRRVMEEKPTSLHQSPIVLDLREKSKGYVPKFEPNFFVALPLPKTLRPFCGNHWPALPIHSTNSKARLDNCLEATQASQPPLRRRSLPCASLPLLNY